MCLLGLCTLLTCWTKIRSILCKDILKWVGQISPNGLQSVLLFWSMYTFSWIAIKHFWLWLWLWYMLSKTTCAKIYCRLPHTCVLNFDDLLLIVMTLMSYRICIIFVVFILQLTIVYKVEWRSKRFKIKESIDSNHNYLKFMRSKISAFKTSFPSGSILPFLRN